MTATTAATTEATLVRIRNSNLLLKLQPNGYDPPEKYIQNVVESKNCLCLKESRKWLGGVLVEKKAVVTSGSGEANGAMAAHRPQQNMTRQWGQARCGSSTMPGGSCTGVDGTLGDGCGLASVLAASSSNSCR